MLLEVTRRHLPALVIVIAAVLLGIIVYPMMPDQIPTHFDAKGNPDKYDSKISFYTLFFTFMVIFFVIIIVIDRVSVYGILPGNLMASVNWVLQGFMAVIYLSTIAVALGVIENFLYGFAFGVGIMVIVLAPLYFKAKGDIDTRVIGLFGSPYFEKVRFSPIIRAIFFIVPYFPRYIIQTTSGIRVIGVLYDVEFAWEDIQDIKSAPASSGISGLSLRLNTKFSGLVGITLDGKRTKLILSPKDRKAFIETAGRFLKRK
jgi:hypothetical protein